MPEVSHNVWAIVVVALSSILIGSRWYARWAFGARWMHLIGKTEDELKRGAASAMGVTVVSSALFAYVLSVVVDWAGAADAWTGAGVALLVWLGFAATVLLTQNLFAQRPFSLFLINAGYHLVQFVVAGAVLAAWA